MAEMVIIALLLAPVLASGAACDEYGSCPVTDDLNLAQLHTVKKRRSDSRPNRMVIAGHRGSSANYPENTMISIRMAFEVQAAGAEFDIQLTKDGKLVVLHDDELWRTAGCPVANGRAPTAEDKNQPCPQSKCPQEICGQGQMTQAEYEENLKTNVNFLSYEDFIQYVDIGSYFDPQFHAERPPLMDDVMQLVPEGKFVLCEVKGGDAATSQLVVQETAARFQGKWNPNILRFIGFHMETMKQIKDLLTEKVEGGSAYTVIWVQDAYTEEKALQVVMEAKDQGFDGVDFEAHPGVVVTEKVVQAARDRNLIIGVWVWKAIPGSDTAENVDAFDALDIDFFTSDLPDDVQAHRIMRHEAAAVQIQAVARGNAVRRNL